MTAPDPATPAGAPVWDLESVLPPHGPYVEGDRLVAAITDLRALYDGHGVRGGDRLAVTAGTAAAFDEVIAATCRTVETDRVLSLYWAGRCWADGRDEVAAAAYARLRHDTTMLPALLARLEAWVARFPLADLAAATDTAAAHRHWLNRAAERARHRLPGGEETLLAGLSPASGARAWLGLYETLTAQATARLDGRDVAVAVAAATVML